MDYLWLIITVLSLVAGVGLLLAILVLRRLSGPRHPPVEVVVAGMVAIGLAAFLGVFLRVLNIPRSVVPYRVLNSAAWGFVVYACLSFLLHNPGDTGSPTQPGRKTRGEPTQAGFFRINRAGIATIAGLTMWGAAFLVVHAPAANLVVQETAILVLELLVGGLAIVTAIAALRRAGRVQSVPWRLVQRGTGVALLVLVPANLIEFLVTMGLRLRGYTVPDGFLFSLGYGIACTVLAVALLRALRIRGLADTGAGGAHRYDAPRSSVPESMVRVLGITPRERDIIEKLLEGRTDREIGELLFISPRTVDTHLRNIFRKCAVTSRLQLSHRVAEYRSTVDS